MTKTHASVMPCDISEPSNLQSSAQEMNPGVIILEIPINRHDFQLEDLQ